MPPWHARNVRWLDGVPEYFTAEWWLVFARRHRASAGEGIKEEDVSRKQWTTLNRLRTGVGRYRASMKKWGLADSAAACECGEPEQTADHIINSCPLDRPQSEAGLFKVGPLTKAWLQQTELTM